MWGRGRGSRPRRPDGGLEQWGRCPGCGEIVPDDEVADGVCPACGHHHPMAAAARLRWLADPKATELIMGDLASSDPLRFKVSTRYRDQLASAQRKGEANEALLAARVRVGGRPIVTAVAAPGFLGGTLGAVAAARLLAAFEVSAEERVPVVLFAAGGGPRVAEGTLALGGLPWIADGRASLYADGIAFISVLCPPAPAGALLALAMSADVVLTEPLPSNQITVTSSRGPLEQGLADRQVERHRLRDEVRDVLDLLAPIG